MTWRAAGLLLALACSHLWAQTSSLPPLLQADGGLHPGWRFVGFPRNHADLPPTRFEPGRVEGVAAVQVLTASSYGTLVHETRGKAAARLQWRWRLDQPLSGGKLPADILTKAGDDAALKVCVMFDHDLNRVPFVERTVLRVARRVSGEALPAATVCYVWDSTHPAFTQGANPYTKRVRFIGLQGRDAPLARWFTESRDVAQDFIDLFADELPDGSSTRRSDAPAVTRVLIGADSDNTASQSSGWVADVRWAADAP